MAPNETKKKPVQGRPKGNVFESTLAKLFSEWTGVPWDRAFRSGGGKQKGDICPVNAAARVTVEAKRREGWSLEQLMEGKGAPIEWWVKLSKEARESNTMPLLVVKQNRRPIYALLRMADAARMGVLLDGTSHTRLQIGGSDVLFVALDVLVGSVPGQEIVVQAT